MIDIKELRRLAQAATPHVGHACKYRDAHWLREGHVDFENADLFIASERPQEDAEFYAAASPATVSELLDRLEAAEKTRDDLLACLDEWLDKTKWVQQGVNEGTISAKYLGLHRADVMSSLLGEAEKERDALRAEVESWKGLAAQFGKEADKAKTHLAFAKDNLNHLRARIEAMEKQEPVAFVLNAPKLKRCAALLDAGKKLPHKTKLYAQAGAQGEKK